MGCEMESEVYLARVRARSGEESKTAKIGKLFYAAGFDNVVKERDLTAIKVHFGELGNDSFVNPILLHPIAENVKERRGRPFLTDTNTLYGGARANAVDHLTTAALHGFSYMVTGCPVIIADGLRSENFCEIEIGQKHFHNVKIASEIARADSMIVVSHFKGHLPFGFGGAIKNLGMGCASAAGKSEQHSAKAVMLNKELCIGCKSCEKICPVSAIRVEEKIASIDYQLCRGCGECLRICPVHAIDFDWLVEARPLVERMVEYALGAVKGKEDRTGFFNVLLNITPDCDCVPWSDAPIVPDIGILASRDPVALDRASFDLVNQQIGIYGSMLERNLHPGQDKFKGLWENTEGLYQIEYGEAIGLGSSRYKLVEV
jgi:uncharacterized Fe-S center protein